MSIDSYAPKETKTGNGTVDTYTFSFTIQAKAQLLWILYDGDGVESDRGDGTDTSFLSSVTFDAVDGGGTVVLQANLTSGYRLVFLQANDAPTQDYQWKDKGEFTLSSFGLALDYIMTALHRLVYRGKQALKLNDLDDEETIEMWLPSGFTSNPGAGVFVNDDGDGFQWGPTAEEVAAAEGYAEAAIVAQAAAEAAQAAAESAQTDSEDAQGYAEEWANKAEDSLISAAAGGDQVDDYSALHHATKAIAGSVAAEAAQSYAEEWANKAEDSLVSAAAGGDEVDDYSALHHRNKAADSAAAALVSEGNAAASELAAASSESNASTSEGNAAASETAAQDAQSYAEEWANKAEDSLVSAAAGGDEVDDYSALHHRNKAEDAQTAAEAAQAAAEAAAALITFTKVTKTYADLSAAALTNIIEALEMSALQVVTGVIIKHSTAFSGGGVTAVKLDVGINAEEDRFISKFDVFQAVSESAKQVGQLLYVGNLGSVTSLKLQATSEGANLDQLTQGSVDIYFQIRNLE